MLRYFDTLSYRGALQRKAAASFEGQLPSILIADDSVEMRRLTRRVIESIPGCWICGEAVDGVDAVVKTRELAPDLIILDLSMPRMSGLDAAHVLRTSGIQVPIILFTLHASVISSSQVSAVGIDAVVPKIADEASLVSQVERLLAVAS